MFRAILIDDEPLAITRLKKLLVPHQDKIEIIATASNGIEGAEKTNRLKPDLIFLDIQMPGLNGFEMLEQLNCDPWIIFCTAFDQYAINAFKTNSIDYLLKPIQKDLLDKAIEKLKLFEQKKVQSDDLQNLLLLLNRKKENKFKIKFKNKILFVSYDEILYFQADEKYVEVFTLDNSYLINDSLNKLEEELSRENFVRIHRSVIVNKEFIKEIIKLGPNSYKIKIKNSQESLLPLSRDMKWKLGI